jgi:hypothetical protein
MVNPDHCTPLPPKLVVCVHVDPEFVLVYTYPPFVETAMTAAFEDIARHVQLEPPAPTILPAVESTDHVDPVLELI